MKFVVDTSVFIDYFRGGTQASKFFDKLEEENADLFIPTIVVFELYSGKSSKNSASRLKIINLIKDFKQIDLIDPIAIRAGELSRDIGKHISAQDYIIAASALEIGAKVVTLNRKDFEKIPGLAIYS